MTDDFTTLRLRLASRHPAAPAAVAALVSHVEWEPAFIPFVRRVDVLDRGENWVRYRVFLPLGMRVTFVKAWGLSAVVWLSESASFGVVQRGRLLLTPDVSGGTRVRLRMWTRFPLPGLAFLSRPLVAYAFRRWLENLAMAGPPTPQSWGTHEETLGPSDG